MINWIMVILIAIAATVGAEMNRRSTLSEGRFVTLLSIAEHRIYCLIGSFGAALFMETARIALSAPSVTHIWYLIGAASLAFVSVTAHLTRELNATRRELEQLQSCAK